MLSVSYDPLVGIFPVSIRHTRQPTPQTSMRSSKSRPSISSGALNTFVPKSIPSTYSPGMNLLETLKSISLTLPLSATITFSGLMSRWYTLSLCKWLTARSTYDVMLLIRSWSRPAFAYSCSGCP